MSYPKRVAIFATAATFAGLSVLPSASAQAPPVYPDLLQEVPSNLTVRSETVKKKNGKALWRKGKKVRRYLLGFRASAVNAGSGPLVVNAHRASTAELEMVTDQIVSLSDGTTITVPDVGRYRFEASGDHSHWHFKNFERYQLRNARGTKLVRRSPKGGIGFCLGSRFRPDPSILLAPDAGMMTPPFDDQCALNQPDMLSFFSGIHPGWSDPYDAYLEGQFFNITGLKAGKYVLVHRVNPKSLLQEAFYNNNSSSVRVRLKYPRGKTRAPRVTVIKRCFAEATC